MKHRNFEDSLRTSTSQISIRCSEQDDMRDPPEMIRQNKFTKTYSKLQCIPLQRHIQTLNPKNIEHLYISHNKIKSLQGIQQFENLVSFNVSYNLLTKIQQLTIIKKPQNILRIGLKMNDFIYGYQDYAVHFFKNLQKLDDIDIKDKSRIKKLQQKGDKVANLFLDFHIRVSRVFVFLDDLIKQQKIHEEMKLKRSSQRSKMNPKLKLLFEHISQRFIAKISSIYIQPTQEEFLHLSTFEILTRIQNTINAALQQDIDLKCSCRPRMPYEIQVQKSFKQLCSQFLQRFQLRYNYELQHGLQKMQRKFEIKIKGRKLQKWELWGMLQNYMTLSLSGKCYQNLTTTIGKSYVQLQNNINEQNTFRNKKKQKADQNQWRNKLFLNENYQNDKQNINPNIPFSQNLQHNENSKRTQNENYRIFYDRIPIILYEKNYVQILLEITMNIIKQLLEKYDYLNKVKTNYLKDLQKKKSLQKKFLTLDQIYEIVSINNVKNQKVEIKNVLNKKMLTKSVPQKCETKRILSERRRNQDNQDNNNQGQFFLRQTVVQNSPSNQPNQLSGKTTQRKFLKRHDSQISFGINQQIQQNIQNQTKKQVTDKKQNNQNHRENQVNKRDYSIYEINLIYKVFRALKMKAIKRKNKRRNNNK